MGEGFNFRVEEGGQRVLASATGNSEEAVTRRLMGCLFEKEKLEDAKRFMTGYIVWKPSRPARGACWLWS